MTARERIEILFDEGTFVEVGNFIESRINYFDMGIAHCCKKLLITDTILRDAHQSQATTRMRIEDMLPACAM